MLQHAINIIDEPDHDRNQSGRVLMDVPHLRRSEIVRQAIADRNSARRLRDARLMLKQGIKVSLRNLELQIACGGFGVLVIDLLTKGARR